MHSRPWHSHLTLPLPNLHNCSYSGLLQTQNVLDFVRFLSDERSFTVWRTAFSALTHLRGVLFPDTLPPPAARQTCINNYDRCVDKDVSLV